MYLYLLPFILCRGVITGGDIRWVALFFFNVNEGK